MMESVVLDNVVFEDVISSNPTENSGEQVNLSETEPSQSSKPINVRSESESSSSPSSSYHPETYSSSPSSYTATPPSVVYPVETYSNQYVSNSSNNNQYASNNDNGAFAPEYHRDSGSFQSDSNFRETSFVQEITPTPQRETIPIDVVVGEPEKFGDGMNSYITYKIKTTASYPKFKDAAVVVRRYNDFLWFHEQLKSNNKGVLIPPLPEKALINRFSAEFIEIRRKELEKFLNRVVQHAILHRRPEVVFFLESNDEQFTAAKSKTTKAQPATEQPPQQQSGGGFGSFVSFLGHGIAAAANLTTTGGTAREIDHWFDAKKNYVHALENQLIQLTRATNKLLQRRKELAAANSDFASAISIVGSTEAETDSYLSTSFIRIGQITDHIKDLCEQLFRNETTHFEEALKDYLRVLGAVKEMLADRDEVLLEYQNASRSLDTKKEKMEKDKARSSSTKSQKELDDAQKKVEDTKREYESISTQVRAELNVFDVTRAREIRRMISLLVQSNMENSLQVVDLWKSYISETQGSDEKDWKTTDKIGWGGIGSLR